LDCELENLKGFKISNSTWPTFYKSP